MLATHSELTASDEVASTSLHLSMIVVMPLPAQPHNTEEVVGVETVYAVGSLPLLRTAYEV